MAKFLTYINIPTTSRRTAGGGWPLAATPPPPSRQPAAPRPPSTRRQQPASSATSQPAASHKPDSWEPAARQPRADSHSSTAAPQEGGRGAGACGRAPPSLGGCRGGLGSPPANQWWGRAPSYRGAHPHIAVGAYGGRSTAGTTGSGAAARATGAGAAGRQGRPRSA